MQFKRFNPRGWRGRTRWLSAIGCVAALAVAVPVAYAAFTDVPPSNPFYADINAIQGAGITQGCGGGNFCPSENITREAVAAWMHRGMPRVAYSGVTADSTIDPSGTPSTDTRVGSVTITVPGAGTGTQFVKLDAVMTVRAGTGTPPFTVYYYLAETDCTGARSNYTSGEVDSVSFYNALPITWVRATTPGVQTYKLCAWSSPPSTQVIAANVHLSAITAPFGSTGASTLGVGAAAADPRP